MHKRLGEEVGSKKKVWIFLEKDSHGEIVIEPLAFTINSDVKPWPKLCRESAVHSKTTFIFKYLINIWMKRRKGYRWRPIQLIRENLIKRKYMLHNRFSQTEMCSCKTSFPSILLLSQKKVNVPRDLLHRYLIFQLLCFILHDQVFFEKSTIITLVRSLKGMQ